MLLRWSRSEPAKVQRLWIANRKGYPLEPIPGTVTADTLVRQCPDGQIVPANLWFKNDGGMPREMKHTSDTFERVLSLLIVPRFEPRCARDGDYRTFDTYDRFIEGGQ